MPTDRQHVAIIGAGIIGTVTALQLQRAGLQVTLVDQAPPGEGCSFGNGGAISPDMCVPIALPGMLRRVPRWLFDPKGPLVVRWRHLPRTFPWLARWIRAGSERRVLAISEALRALHGTSYSRYQALLGEHAKGLLEMTGQIYVWRTEQPAASEQFARQLRTEHGIDTKLLNRAALANLDPHLAPEFRHGLFFPENGHTVNPLRLVQTVVGLFEQAGGNVVRRRVLEFGFGHGGVKNLRCEDGELAADAVVVAAGIDSAAFARMLGDRLPLQAERGYHVMLPDPGIRPAIKISNREHMFGITPMEHGVRIAGTVEIASPDAPMDENRARAMLEHAQRMYPELNPAGATFWMGSRPSTPDSLPIIDRSSGAQNVIYAFGHGHFGLTGAPITADIVAAHFIGRPPPVPVEPYQANRFRDGW